MPISMVWLEASTNQHSLTSHFRSPATTQPEGGVLIPPEQGVGDSQGDVWVTVFADSAYLPRTHRATVYKYLAYLASI